MAFLIGGANTLAADAGVANSCRFNDGDSPRHQKDFADGHDTAATISLWFKRCTNSAAQTLFECFEDASNYFRVRLESSEELQIRDRQGGSDQLRLKTSALFRDPSAWYSLIIIIDTTDGTAADRCKVYINGTRVTSFGTETTYGSSDTIETGNADCTVNIGGSGGSDNYLDGYMAEVVFLDGVSQASSGFGEFDEDSPTIWKPINVSGLTFGTNGFYLDFEDSSNLGNDKNGGTDLTEANLAATDQATDTPTNNFATINPLDNFYANATLSDGNLKMVSGSSRECSSTATIALSNGKWFWEYEVTTFSAPFGGIQPIPSFGNTASAAVLQTNGLGYLKTGKVETTDGSGGSTELASYATYAVNDIIGVALDLDAGTNIIYFYKNGALQGSGVNLTHVDSTANGHYLIAFGAVSGQDTFEINFGNPITALDSANADANGYGAFEFAVPSGFFSICTKNLAEYG